MGEVRAEVQPAWENFGRSRLPLIVAIFLRTTGNPALAFDLATETLATAKTEWQDPPEGNDEIVALLQLGAQVLAAAAERHTVPTVERRRHRQTTPLRLTLQDQQAVMQLAEANLDLPSAGLAAAEALGRSAPVPTILRQIRLSGLVEAEPMPDHVRSPDDA